MIVDLFRIDVLGELESSATGLGRIPSKNFTTFFGIIRAMSMIAIIPAAGLGTRFLPATKVVPKEMLPIGNRPALDLIVEEARSAGATEIVIIISHAKELIREYFKDAPDVRFVYQEEQRGLGHAVLQVGENSSSSPTPTIHSNSLLILLGDAVVLGCNAAKEMAEYSAANGGASVIGCEKVPREKVSRYGVMKLRGDRIVDMVEKPSVEEAPSDIVVAGRYLLDAKIFDYLRTQTPGKGGEIQLTDSIRRMIADGTDCRAYVYPGRRHDIGNPDGYFETLSAFHSSTSTSHFD